MKKLVFLFAAVLLTAISVNVFAQNNGVTPTPGSTFTYNVTNNGNSYLWSVTKGDLVTPPTNAADVTIGTPAAATTTIKWASSLSIGDIYYVHLLETDANSCSNQKVLKVTITASQFSLAIAANNASPACYNGPVALTLDGSGDPLYDHGAATLSYTVTPTNIGSATGYSFSIAELLSQTTNFASAPSVTSGNGSIAAGTVTVTNTSTVTIQFVITNSNKYTNATDAAGTAADFNQKVDISNGVTSLGVPDNGTDGTYTKNTDVVRPHTTGIGYN